MRPADVDRPHVVYILRNRVGAPIYVGVSCNLEGRLDAHRARFGGLIASVQVESTHPNGLVARAREAEVIRELEPPHNVTYNPARERADAAYQVLVCELGIRAVRLLDGDLDGKLHAILNHIGAGWVTHPRAQTYLAEYRDACARGGSRLRDVA